MSIKNVVFGPSSKGGLNQTPLRGSSEEVVKDQNEEIK